MALASILPMPRAVFYDANGNQLGAGLVYTYVPNTTTPKTTGQDSGEVTPHANPITLDAAGSCLLYGAGSYTLNVTDSLGNAIPAYSGLTFDAATSAGISPVMVPVVGAATIAIAQAAMNVAGVYNIQNTSYAGGADPSGLADSTMAINAAITACQNAGAGIVWFPPGTYLVSGTISVTASGVQLLGAGLNATVLQFTNGTNDCIVFAGVSQFSTIQGCSLRNMTLNHSGKSGGRTVYGAYVTNILVENLIVLNAWNGFEFFVFNTLYIRDIWGEIIFAPGGFMLFIHAPGDGVSGRNDYCAVDRFTWNAQYGLATSGAANGIVIDGYGGTFLFNDCNILQTGVGFFIGNSANTAFTPSFIHVRGMSMEGCQVCGFTLNTGSFFKMSDSDISVDNGQLNQGNADVGAFIVNPGTGGDIIRSVKVSNCTFFGTVQDPVQINAINVTFVGCEVSSWPTTVPDTTTGFFVGASASDVLIMGCQTFIFGASNNLGNGVAVAVGASRVQVIGNDLVFAQNVPVLWESTDPHSISALNMNSGNGLTNNPSLNPIPTGVAAGVTITGAGQVLTGEEMVNGVLEFGGTAGAQTVTTCTAASLCLSAANIVPTSQIYLSIVNNNNGTITLAVDPSIAAGGSSASFSIASGAVSRFMFQITNPIPTVSAIVAIYGI